MYKVLLVDDEPYSIEGLKTMFKWEDYGFTVCGVAGDGKTALDYLNCLNPDLVITDIMMPELDGLQFIQYATETLKTNAKFIVLSGYDNFAYAQAAIKYGVFDYLLKPLDIDELNEVIAKAIKEIKKQENIQRATDKKLSYIVNSSITRLLNGELKDSIINRLEFILDMNVNDDICCLLIEVDDPKPLEDSHLLKNSVRKIIEKVLGFNSKFNLYEDSNGRFCIIATYKMYAYTNPCSFCDTLKQEIYESLSASVSIAISSCNNGMASLTELYNQAIEAMQYKFYFGEGKIINYSDIENKKISHDFCKPEYNLLLNHIKSNQKDNIKNSIDLIFNEFLQKNSAQDIVWHYLLNLQAEIVAIIQSSNSNSENFINRLIAQNLKMENYSLIALKKGFIEFANEVSDYLSASNDTSTDVIEKVKEFISQNYSKNIKLQSISDIFSINSVYLGQLFKKTTGMYFNEYLHFIRIEEGKKLLRRTSMKITDISNSLGYADSEYFVAKFKHFTTMTPSEYKRKFNHQQY